MTTLDTPLEKSVLDGRTAKALTKAFGMRTVGVIDCGVGSAPKPNRVCCVECCGNAVGGGTCEPVPSCCCCDCCSCGGAAMTELVDVGAPVGAPACAAGGLVSVFCAKLLAAAGWPIGRW